MNRSAENRAWWRSLWWMWLAAPAAACGPDFVDATPPELVSIQRKVEVVARDEPLVFQILLDLHLPDSGECARTRDRIDSEVRAAMFGRSAAAVQLPTVDLSPGCQQSPSRTYDRTATTASLGALEQTLGRAPIRPILVYFNNVQLPLPQVLKDSLWNRGDPASGRPKPLLWGTAFDPVLKSGVFDGTYPWTFSTDPSLLDGVRAAAEAELPLVTTVATPLDARVFTDDELQWVREFKGCSVDSRIHGIEYPLDGRAVALEQGVAPHYSVDRLVSQPTERTKAPPATLSLDIEACSARCDRFRPTPDGLDRWNAVSTCLIQGAQQ